MIKQGLLFNDGELRIFLEQRESRLFSEIESQDEKYILNVDPQEFKKYLIEKYQLTAPTLNEDKIYVDKSEEEVDVSQDGRRIIHDRSRPFYVKGLKVYYHIPFEGDSNLFKYQTSRYSFNPPRAEVMNNKLVVEIIELDHNIDSVKRDFEQNFNEIKKWLECVNQQISQFNNSLDAKIEQKVNTRKEKLIKDQTLVSDLGFPLKKREDAPQTFAIPVKKKKIHPLPVVSESATPLEPSLNIEEYDKILKIITNMSLVMERSPKSFKKMKEPDLRTHFLVQLNGQYEGQATGETFNNQGKTDILIRVNGKNIFIGECKFWKGKESLIETIDQLLSYTSWRDTKTTILLFNRNKDLSNVLKQIPDILKEHNNYKEKIEYGSEIGFRFKLHHNDDEHKELILTILVFEVPK